MNILLKRTPSLSKILLPCINQQRRHFNLQEHASYSLLNEYGIKTPRFGEAKCVKGAEKIARDLLTQNLMVKAQVMTGGRGLGRFKNGFKGGVHSAIRYDLSKLFSKDLFM